MVRIQVEYQGSLRCQATHGPSQNTLLTDAPVDNHGRGESFSPTDLVATALGTCMLTVMGIVAERHEWPLTGARVEVVKHMQNEPARKIARLEAILQLPGELDASARKALEAAARGCPVARSLEGSVELDVRFEWGVPSHS